MNKQDIITKITTDLIELPRSKIETILEMLIKIITESVKENEKIKISGLGTFSLKEMKERPGINPQTKEKMIVPAYKTVKFKASETLKKAVRQ